MSLLDILHGVGNVLDTPGSVVRGLLSGNAGRAFGGIFDPEQRVSGRDLTNSLGLTDENSGLGGDVAGFAAGLATDPLMWGGGALLRMLGRGGETAAAGAKAAGLGEEATAAGKAATAAGGNRFALAGELTPDFAINPRAVMALEPADAAATGSRLGDMLQARNEFTMLKGLGLDANNLPKYRAVGGLGEGAGATAAERAMDVHEAAIDYIKRINDSSQKGPGMFGGYNGLDQVAAIPDLGAAKPSPLLDFLKSEDSAGVTKRVIPSAREIIRHEGLHGIINNAEQAGNIANLALLPRIAVAARASGNHGLGTLAEEAAAHAIEKGSSPLQQLTGITGFLSNPKPGYAGQIASTNPQLANVFYSALVPRLGLAGYGAGTAGGASALAALLGGGE